MQAVIDTFLDAVSERRKRGERPVSVRMHPVDHAEVVLAFRHDAQLVDWLPRAMDGVVQINGVSLAVDTELARGVDHWIWFDDGSPLPDASRVRAQLPEPTCDVDPWSGEPLDRQDREGVRITLSALCHREPAWAANRIRALEAELLALLKERYPAIVPTCDCKRCGGKRSAPE